jgi:hypothetical protein
MSGVSHAARSMNGLVCLNGSEFRNDRPTLSLACDLEERQVAKMRDRTSYGV